MSDQDWLEAYRKGEVLTSPSQSPVGVTPATSSRLRRLRFWKSPADQPAWARPALLAIAAVAAFSYAWGIGTVTLESFYGAAARSMSESWHNFIFGSFDPWGTVSVDKIPGALWVQALSLRLFGFHLWAIALPQVVEGTLTVLVLYRVVRRVAGPGAGLAAALVLAVSPVTVLLNRGNISDSVLILLLVLAADATTTAIANGRLRSLVLAGVWVGLAFQAKMLQAWLVLPALYLAYLVAAPTVSVLRRFGDIALSALVVVVVSLSWMTAVSAVPAHDRPYADGSCDDSIFSQVFLYNGINRFSVLSQAEHGCNPPPPFLVTISKDNRSLGIGTAGVGSGWTRLFSGVFGRDDAWMLVPSIVAALGLFRLRRRAPRTDLLRASCILWVTWLVLTWIFFSSGRYLNSYYVAALIPAMAALCGMGAAEAWRHRHSTATRGLVLVTVMASTAYALLLLPQGAGVRPWIIGTSVMVAVLAIGTLAGSLRRGHASVWSTSVGLAAAALALLSGPAWASASVVATGLGPFDTPYQPNSITYVSQTLPNQEMKTWPALNEFADEFPSDQAADVLESSAIAATDTLATGHEFLSIGGFTGEVPTPSLRQLIHFVAEGRVSRVQTPVAPLTKNPDLLWVTQHCARQITGETTFPFGGSEFRRFICTPDDASGQPCQSASPSSTPGTSAVQATAPVREQCSIAAPPHLVTPGGQP